MLMSPEEVGNIVLSCVTTLLVDPCLRGQGFQSDAMEQDSVPSAAQHISEVIFSEFLFVSAGAHVKLNWQVQDFGEHSQADRGVPEVRFGYDVSM